MSESPSILVVASDQEFCRELAGALLAAGFRVDVASSGREALCRAQGSRYERVVLDLRLCDITGILVYMMLRGIDPDLPRRTLFVSGRLPGRSSEQNLGGLGLGFLSRPFGAQDLLHRLGLC